jgi:hypothetical protein
MLTYGFPIHRGRKRVPDNRNLENRAMTGRADVPAFRPFDGAPS